MSIMQQSSKAQDRTLGVWFFQIQQGTIKLPRFQRFEAWDRGRITSFLNTIINNLPVGVLLALEVAGKEKFESRYIATSDPKVPMPVTQNLLDGQQRLTALWRSVHNNYQSETFFVYLRQFHAEGNALGSGMEIVSVPRWINKNQRRMPRWAEEPEQCLRKGLIPFSLLRPGDISQEIDNWLNAATRLLKPLPDQVDFNVRIEAFYELKERIKKEITTLRERVAYFNLPYLSLPADTEKDVALQVFINMNTNSKPLSLYDIIVAEVESVAEQSLHDLVDELKEKCPKVSRLGDVSDLVLSTSALLQEKLPNTRGMLEMDKKQLIDTWSKLEHGLGRMASFLESQRIFDEARLPTNAVLAVVAASYDLIPNHGDLLAKAEKLLRRYIWSSFFTDRYENTAASRAFADFSEIKKLLKRLPDFTDDEVIGIPVLNRKEFPLPDVDSLIAAGWPKATGINARAILAVTTYLGAIDFADGTTATYEGVQNREYHHVFPDALLAEANINSYLALNCALITWKTNRMIGRKDPLDYLKERVQWADEGVVRDRLKSHLISFDMLSKAHYVGMEGAALEKKLSVDFNHFLRDRAELVFSAMSQLTEGATPSLDSIWTSHEASVEIENSEGETYVSPNSVGVS